MLFRKDIDPSCAYCAQGGSVDTGHVICKRCGVVPIDHACRHFVYAPLRRVPPKPRTPDFAEFDQDDFSIDGEL